MQTFLEFFFVKSNRFADAPFRDMTFTPLGSADEKIKLNDEQLKKKPFLTAADVCTLHASSLLEKKNSHKIELQKRLWSLLFGFPKDFEGRFQILKTLLQTGKLSEDSHRQLIFPNFIYTQDSFAEVTRYIETALNFFNLHEDPVLFQYGKLPEVLRKYFKEQCGIDQSKYEAWYEKSIEILNKYKAAEEKLSTAADHYSQQIKDYITLLEESCDYSVTPDVNKMKALFKSANDFSAEFATDFPGYTMVHAYMLKYLTRLKDKKVLTPTPRTTCAFGHKISELLKIPVPGRETKINKYIYEIIFLKEHNIDTLFDNFLLRSEITTSVAISSVSSLNLGLPCSRLTANLNNHLKALGIEIIPAGIENQMLTVQCEFTVGRLEGPLKASRSKSPKGNQSPSPLTPRIDGTASSPESSSMLVKRDPSSDSSAVVLPGSPRKDSMSSSSEESSKQSQTGALGKSISNLFNRKEKDAKHGEKIAKSSSAKDLKDKKDPKAEKGSHKSLHKSSKP